MGSFRISMVILSEISATTHAVLTLCKRIVVMLTASFYFGSHLGAAAVTGILLSGLGTLGYAHALSTALPAESSRAVTVAHQRSGSVEILYDYLPVAAKDV